MNTLRFCLCVVIVAVLCVVPGRAQTHVIDVTLLSADSVDETTECHSVNMRSYLTVYIEWSAGVSAGVIEVEEYYTSGYTGTPAQIQQVTTSAADSTDVVHLPISPYRTICTRISTGISGGTVTTRLVG